MRRAAVSNDYPVAERAEKYEYIHPRPSKNYDYSWDVLQIPMIILWRSMPKSMNTSIQDHLKTSIIAETCFSFQWLSCCGACWKYECIHPGPTESYDYRWDALQFPMIILWRSVLKSMNTSIQDHLKTVIIAETCFDFQWLSYGRACWKVWIHPSQTIKKLWL